MNTAGVRFSAMIGPLTFGRKPRYRSAGRERPRRTHRRVASRGRSDVSPEVPGEVRLVVEADLHRDTCGGLAVEQPPARRVDPAPDQVPMRRDAERRGEAPHEVRGRHVEDPCRLSERRRAEPVVVEEVSEIWTRHRCGSVGLVPRPARPDARGAARPRRRVATRPRTSRPDLAAPHRAHGTRGRSRIFDGVRSTAGPANAGPSTRCPRRGRACGSRRRSRRVRRVPRAAAGRSRARRPRPDAAPRGRSGPHPPPR